MAALVPARSDAVYGYPCRNPGFRLEAGLVKAARRVLTVIAAASGVAAGCTGESDRRRVERGCHYLRAARAGREQRAAGSRADPDRKDGRTGERGCPPQTGCNKSRIET